MHTQQLFVRPCAPVFHLQRHSPSPLQRWSFVPVSQHTLIEHHTDAMAAQKRRMASRSPDDKTPKHASKRAKRSSDNLEQEDDVENLDRSTKSITRKPTSEAADPSQLQATQTAAHQRDQSDKQPSNEVSRDERTGGAIPASAAV